MTVALVAKGMDQLDEQRSSERGQVPLDAFTCTTMWNHRR